MHVGFFERLLQFAHPAADHRTRPRASRVNEIRDPDFAAQLRRAKRLPILIRQLEYRHRAVFGNGSLPQRVHLDTLQPEQTHQSHHRNGEQCHLPSGGA